MTWRWVIVSATLGLVAAACSGGGGDDTGSPNEGARDPDDAEGSDLAALVPEIGEADPQCAGESDGVLRIGGLLPETGGQKILGPPQRAGAKLAVREINEAGGVLGRDVELMFGDSGDDTTDIAQTTVRRHLDAGADVIVGAATSSVSLEVIDTITGACKIQFSASNTAPDFTSYDDGDLYFRTVASDVLQGRALADLAAEDGNRTLAVLARQGPYGDGLREFVRLPFEQSGGQVVVDEGYDPQAPAFGAEARTVVEANPDALVLIGFEESSRVLQALFDRGFTPDRKSIYLVDGNVGDDLGQDFPPGALAGIKGTLPAAKVADGFRDRLRLTNPGLRDFTYGPEAYDAVVVTALAAVAAGTDDPAAVARHINGITREGEPCNRFGQCSLLLRAGHDIDYTGPSGPLEFSRPGEPTSASIAVLTYRLDNRIDRSATTYRFAELTSTGGTE